MLFPKLYTGPSGKIISTGRQSRPTGQTLRVGSRPSEPVANYGGASQRLSSPLVDSAEGSTSDEWRRKERNHRVIDR
ncbi:hypothetical protein N657DRAFT_645036 [Parathielavia appendiculata]|uniref:Uncharacterized protein n=1 Tax=Parathielavia appendiculata TaxID=2587402 RepID=A0AAN6Z3H1_9PEZI|nr:hypothetical protein N657DRAFT_645036 [Parathielavia appendiculata]